MHPPQTILLYIEKRKQAPGESLDEKSLKDRVEEEQKEILSKFQRRKKDILEFDI